MTKEKEMKITELLCSKLCHDLISPISAINNGLEFLQDDSGGMFDDAVKLIGDSAHLAADRLTYFRLALGGNGAVEPMDLNIVENLINKLAVEKKVNLEWLGIESGKPAKINPVNSKILLSLALVAFECLPRGGQVEIALENLTENLDIIISVSGDKCNLREDVESGFNSQILEDSLTVRNILPFYCINLANFYDKTLKLLEKSPSLIVFKVS